MLDTVDFNHVQHISFTQSRLTDAVSVILSELLSYEHPPKAGGLSVSKKSSICWAFSFERGKITGGGEQDAGTRKNGPGCS